MDAGVPEDPDIKATVLQMQAELEADPQYAPNFVAIGEAAIGLSTTGSLSGECVLCNLVMDVFRDSTGTHLALATASSIREPIAPGPIIEEELRMALPYANKLMKASMTGAQVKDLLDYSVSRAGSDFFSQISGMRFRIVDGKAEFIRVLADPSNAYSGYVALDPQATYQVATTDFQALIADGYRQRFEGLELTSTEIDLRDQVRAYIAEKSRVTAALDGRIRLGPPAPVDPGDPVDPPVDHAQGCGCRTSAAPSGALAGLLLVWAAYFALRRRRW